MASHPTPASGIRTRQELEATLEAEDRLRKEQDPCAMFGKLLLVLGIGALFTLQVNDSTALALVGGISRPAFAAPKQVTASVAAARAAAARPAVAAGYAAAFLALQALSLPGVTLLTLGAGAALGMGAALPLTAALTALGSTLSYGVSQRCARGMMHAYLPDRLSVLRPAVAAARARSDWLGVTMELCFLRLSPLTPCWVLNMAVRPPRSPTSPTPPPCSWPVPCWPAGC